MLSDEDITHSLSTAVREGNLETARELINSYGLSYSPEWSHGYVLLCDAVENKFAEVTKLLLTSGSIVNSNSTEPCDTPLHFAARNGDMEIVKMLLDKGANISAKNQRGRTPLHEAIKNKAMDVTELLLRHGADVNASDVEGLTPLHFAAETECLQIVEHLLNYGASVNCVCILKFYKGYAPLHFAVAVCREEVVTLLLNRGAHADVKGEDGVTPLHIAADRGCINIVESLLNHGACINFSTLKEGYTPLHIATNSGHETVVKLLLQHGAEVDNRDKDGKTVLHLAAKTGNLTIVEDVLKYCPDINDESNRSSLKIAMQGNRQRYERIVEALLEYGFIVNPEDVNDPELLQAAVEEGYLKVIEDLLKYGADVNMLYNSRYEINPLKQRFYDRFTPLHTAAYCKQEEVAKLLISYNADINAQDKTRRTPIFYAIKKSDLKIFNLLLTDGANIKDSPELLNTAVEEGCMEIVEALLQRNVDVNARDEYGRTALHYTGLFDSYLAYTHINIKGEIAKLLLSKGADVDAQTENGETPLHFSVQGRNKEITIMLLNKGANVDAEQKDGTTPLYIATKECSNKIVKVLLEYGAKVDLKTEDDVTPLHVAAELGYQKIIETILKFGADINCRERDGRTALHIASEEGHVEVVRTLLQYGADINITSRNNHTPIDEALNSPNRKTYSYEYVDDDDDDFNDPVCSVCPCEVVAEALKRHIVKMKTANLYVSEKNLQSVDWSDEMRDFQNKCEEEIIRMKSEKINNLNSSFYDILAKCTSSLAVYMRNEDIVQVLKSDDYKTEFPIYASMIETHFRKGMKKNELLEQANKNFHSFFNTFPELPYDCTEKIFSYLSDEDLNNFNRCLQAS